MELDAETIKQLATDVNNVADASFQAGYKAGLKKAFEPGGLVDKMVEVCKDSPAPNFFSQFADFAEECMLKPNMAVYRRRFAGLTTFLRSCQNRSAKTLQALTLYKASGLAEEEK